MIRKIKIKGVWVGEEKELTAKKGPSAGQTFKVCKVGFFTPDEDAEFGGRFIGGSISGNKNQTPKQVAEDLKKKIEGGEGDMILDISESDKLDKDGKKYVNFRIPKAAEIEAVKPYLK